MADAPAAAPLDDFLVRHAPAPAWPLEPGLLRARQDILHALELLVGIRGDALERAWPWRGDEADVRYGLYRQYEALEEARAAIRPLLAGGSVDEPPARPMLGAATAARWDLHGLLAGLSDADLDRQPTGDEWNVRQTLGHIVGGQRGYNWGSAWWLNRRDAPADDFPQFIPDDVSTGMPDDEQEGEGALPAIRARLDDVVDQGGQAFAGLTADDLSVRARWSGIAVDVRFRLGRWASHIREHTIQVEKTLVMVGRPISEVERVVRIVASTYGRIEEALFMWPAGEPAVGRAAELVAQRAAQIAADAASVAEAASRD